MYTTLKEIASLLKHWQASSRVLHPLRVIKEKKNSEIRKVIMSRVQPPSLFVHIGNACFITKLCVDVLFFVQ